MKKTNGRRRWHGTLFDFCSRCFYYGIAFPVLWAADALFFGLRVRGREQLKKLRGRGAVLVCNHVHWLDCTFLGLAAVPRRLVFVSLASNFHLPVAGALVRLLGAVPTPQGLGGMSDFLEQLTECVRGGEIAAIYPEGVLVPYAEGLRPFKSGAFFVAAAAGAPVLPAVITYRKPRGFWRWRRRPTFTVTLLEPLWPEAADGDVNRQAKALRGRVRAAMEQKAALDDTRREV